ncbi:MAG: hypothetical protein ABIZ70_02740 [Gemmatimonadales bacterium]
MKLREVDFLALLSAAICIALGIVSYNAINPDGVAYLDLAARLREADWGHFVQGYWSPLYPFLIAVAAAATGREGADLIGLVHLLNPLIALFGVVVVWWAARQSDNRLFARAAFPALLVCSAQAPRVEAVTPDLLLVALVAMIGFELLRPNGVRWRRLGVLMGIAFLAKTSMWPWLLASLIVRLFAARSGDARREVAKSGAICLAVMLLWIVPLSIKSGTPTLGSAARLNACWYTRECDSRSPDTHAGNHQRYQTISFGASQATVAVLTGTPWTYAPWSDPTEWAAGVTSYESISPTVQEVVRYAFTQLVLVFVPWMWHVWLLIVLPLAFLTRRPGIWRELALEQRSALVVLLLGLLGLFQFIAVHVEPRLIAPFVLLFTLGVAAWLTRFGSESEKLPALRDNRYFVLAFSLVGILGTLPRAWVHGRDQWAIAKATSERLDMISRAEAARVPPRSGPRRIAVIGQVFPLLNEAYRLGGTIEWQVLRPTPAAVLAWPAADQQGLVAWLAQQGATEAWLNKGGGAFSVLQLPPR